MIIALKITLNNTHPAIWRRVLVPGKVTFFDLHHILQITMGWTNSHLFEFKVGEEKIGFVDDILEGFEDVTDANEVRIDSYLSSTGMAFEYLYDFGDAWKHTVVVEEISSPAPDQKYPICVDGELACPHEDSGGVDGHYANMSILNQKKHPEYKEVKTWLGRGYDPQKFSLEKVNKELPRFKKYMKHWDL